ncbi:GNAT family N-acetyltransferase [Paenibacillus sp. 481]|uniref:GNAT family N-acetyltransferase n=1 Tax=Paenibacillus sp. 481 TaxID=2835869 RepID=UPI001E2FFFD5|nr:GNAT family N-acetyltransferase [Paenibacillus sp. 481]UHA73223.1 GNAT family N-acetyltransferase [Paenibacillus sp. 481]
MNIRHVRETDYIPVISVIDEWWGGRQMADMLPKLFFQHFQDTSYVVEQDGQIVGFLIGFVSQSYPEQAYIHFVGVHTAYRNSGIARSLYERFFATVKGKGCTLVRCVTSPVNNASIAYHTRMGFLVENGSALGDGVQAVVDYDGVGQDRVLFIKKLHD